MPIVEWPQQDRSAWQAALSPGDLLDDAGMAAHWSAITRRNVARSYGRWLQHLRDAGILDADAAPEARTAPKQVVLYIRELQREVALTTLAQRLRELGEALRVMVPRFDLSWLRRMEGGVRSSAVPVRSKTDRLRPSSTLFELGFTLMRRAEASGRKTARHRANLYRDGLMIALMAARPLRLKNFASLQIGHELTQRGGEWWIVIAGDQLKARRPIERPLPMRLGVAIDGYLEIHRPSLLRVPRSGRTIVTDALWISQWATVPKHSDLNYRFTTITKRELGVAISPHRFRDCAATSIAVDHPQQVSIIQSVLGHATPQTAERYYNQARTCSAATQFQAAIERIRANLINYPTDDPEASP